MKKNTHSSRQSKMRVTKRKTCRDKHSILIPDSSLRPRRYTDRIRALIPAHPLEIYNDVYIEGTLSLNDECHTLLKNVLKQGYPELYQQVQQVKECHRVNGLRKMIRKDYGLDSSGYLKRKSNGSLYPTNPNSRFRFIRKRPYEPLDCSENRKKVIPVGYNWECKGCSG